MVIIYTSSRRAVLRRFAALLIAPQLKDLFVTTLRVALPLSASCRDAPQFNSTICLLQRCALQRFAPLLTALLCIVSPRSASRRSAPLLPAELLKATRRFVCYDATRLMALLRSSALRHACLRSTTQRFVCYAAPLHASSRLGSLQCNASQLNTAPRNSTICFLQRPLSLLDATHCTAVPRYASLLIASQRNDLFVTSQRDFARLASTPRATSLRAATICLLQRNPMQLVWPRRAAAHCLSPQLNDLFVTSQLGARRYCAALCVASPRTATQRTETLTRKTNVQTFEKNFGNV